MIKSKRGDLQVTLLVLLVLIASTTFLVLFHSNNSKVKADFYGPSNNYDLILQKNYIDFYLDKIYSDAFIDTYKYYSQNKNRFISPLKSEGEYDYFDGIKTSFKSDFLKDLSSNIQSNARFYQFLGDYEVNQQYLEDLRTKLLEGDFDLEFNKDHSISLKTEIDLFSSNDLISSKYSHTFSKDLSFNDLGLESFDKIYFIKKDCESFVSLERLNECFSSNLILDSEVKEISLNDKNLFLVSLKSKDKEELFNLQFLMN